tara:strand:- start:536 stop:847 length:312 start_codon:yes stop_codon:yes gene_type:complete
MENTKIRIPTVFKVAGVSFHKQKVESLTEGDILTLERDPENKYDSNAVKILNSEGEMIGFVPKEFNSAIVRKFKKVSTVYTLKVKNIHKWDGPTGLEVEFTKD